MDVRSALTGGSRRSWLPWVAAVVLAVGLGLTLGRAFHVWGGSKHATPAPRRIAPSTPPPAASSRGERTVPLEKTARAVARRFVLTAVARRHVADSYDLVSADLRHGLTRAQWATGNIPIVPYPVDQSSFASLAVDFSYKNHALLEVTLFPQAGSKGVDSQQFFMELRAVGEGKARRWVVVAWVPHAAPVVPIGGN